MNHHRLLSSLFAFVVGIIGVMGLLATLSLPAAAQPNAAWQAVDLDHVPLAENPSAIAAAIEPVEAALSLPPLDWPVTIPPTHSLPYRPGGSPPVGVSRSSTPPAYHPGFNATQQNGPAQPPPLVHATDLAEASHEARTAANLDSLNPTGRSLANNSHESLSAPLAPPMSGSADLAICLNTDRVWGVVSAGETVTVAVNDTPMGANLADASGFFWTTLYAADGQRPGLTAVDDVAIYHGTSAGVTLGAIDAQIDLLHDVVSGTLGGVPTPIDVTVYVPWGEPTTASYSKTVSTDILGNFSADMSDVWNLKSEDTAVVSYIENGIEVHRHVYPAHSLMVRAPWQTVRGFAAPGSLVTVTVYLSDSVSVKEVITATTALDLVQGGWRVSPTSDLVASDIVVAQFADGVVLSRTVDPLTINVDPINDQLTGQAQPGALIVGTVDDLTTVGWRTKSLTTTANGSGAYTLDFSSIADIMPGQWGGVYVPDAEGDDLNLYNNSPAIEVDQTWNEVSGNGNFAPMASTDQPVTLTIYSNVSGTESSYVSSLTPYNEYAFTRENGFAPDIESGDVITVENGGWLGVVNVMPLTVQVDPDLDQFTGTVVQPTQRVELSGNYNQPQLYPANGQFALLGTANGSFTLTPAGFDVRGDLVYNVAHRTPEDYLERISRGTDVLGAVIPWNAHGGVINPPGTAYTVTLYAGSWTFKAQLTGESEQSAGNIWQDFWSTGQQIEPGDHLQLQSAAGFSYTVEIPAITINPDPATNTISGYGPANALLLVSVDNQGQGYVPTAGDGRFAVAIDQLQEFWGDGSLEWGENVWVNYYDENNTWIVDVFNWPQIFVRYQMDTANDIFGFNAFPGSTIYFTITHPINGIIATGSTPAGSGGQGPASYQLDFPPNALAPGNTVTVNFGNGYMDAVTVVAVTGYADPAANMITGTAPANSQLSAFAQDRFGGQSDSINNIQVDATGVYTADFNTVGWDIQYGDTFHVYYPAPHGHNVEYAFWLPAPDVSVNKWNPSGGYARPGGVMAYAIEYSNWGNGDAENTIITDTLPLYTTYAGDNSGVTHEIGADGVITWNLGTLPPNTDRYFMVTLDVSPSAPIGWESIPENCASITTTSFGDSNSGNDISCSGPVGVQNDEVEISVDKWPNPNDPAPGEEFEYTLRVCNNRGAAVGPIWLTDTLPLYTTLISWWPDNQQNNYWTEVITTGGQLALYAPGLSGNMCDHVRVRLHVAAGVPAFTTLTNVIVAVVEGDVDLNNNQRTNTIRTSPPRYDLNLNKNTNSGVLVPGGWINYHISYNNQGNSPVHAWVTDTLPTGTTYQPNSAREQNGGPPFPPALIDGQTVVWDLGTIGVGQGYGFDFSIDINGALMPGTVLTNCATIGLPAPDDTPWDNTGCVAETINDHGPNLRVIKRSVWENNYQQLRYDAQFQNIGDQQLDHVWLTDTLPAATTFGWLNLGFDWNRVESNNQSPTVQQFEFSTLYPGDSGWLFFGANLDDPNARPSWYTNTIEIDTPAGDVTPDDNYYLDEAFNGEVNRVELRVGVNRIDMWGQAQPNSTLTVTTAYTEVTAAVDNWGNWNINQEGSSISPGDTVTVAAGNGTVPVVIQVPAPFDVQADSITDRVWGQIDALDQQAIEVDLAGYLTKIAQTDGSGSFTRFFADVPSGGQGEVRYNTTIDAADVIFHHDFQSPDLILTVDLSHDWVETSYEAGHTIWITVTDSTGAVKATMVDTTQVVPWWNGGTGFSTNLGIWSPNQPDIAPGDWVYGALDNGYTSSVRVGTIAGNLDLGDDSISGTVTADWFAQALNAQCWIDNVNNSNQDFTVNPSGGTYACDFTAVWDLVPGQNVTVQYQEPDGDWVRTVFRGPTPHVKIQKQGNGSPGEGGSFTFRIYYENNGDGDAENTVITDTLLYGMTYLTDTTDLPHTGSGAPGDPLVWQLGTLTNSTSGWFDLFVQITATAGEPITNTVQIATSNPYDEFRPWEYNNGWGKESWWWADVQANNTHLNIGKSAWTNDPAAGYDIVFTVNPCNNGSTTSNQVIITDTLHPSLTLQSWWGQYPGWAEVFSDAHMLVVSYPTLPDGQCSQFYLRARLDESAWPGMSISNTAVVTASNDLEDNDNETNWQSNVNNPHTNLNINKNWNWGQLVPGGQIRYNINFSNNGNVPVTSTIRITDTFPVSTTFNTWNFGGWSDITLIEVTADYAVWELSGLDNGYEDRFEVVLDVDGAALPGTVLTNTAEIRPQPVEDNYEDNTSIVIETLFDHGPNLRVTKWGGWHGDRAGHAWYQFAVENVGDVAVSQVVVTDTYPLSMMMEWGVNTDWNRVAGFTHDTAGHWFTATLENVNPGYRLDFNFNTTMATPVSLGLILTNTVTVPHVSGDTNAADDSDDFVLATGPDLYVEKTLVGGTFLPGEVITFSLRFGNDQPVHTWWWNTQGNVWITDTLPTGLEYITSTLRWCGGPDCPYIVPSIASDQLVFGVGPQNTSSWNEIYLTVRITDTAEGGHLFTNQVEIASDQPVSDTEPYYDNNHDEYDVLIELPVFEVGKVYASNRVAGTVVTYTLTVTNHGNLTATNVQLIDQLPASMTYGGSDGTYGGGWITWTLPSVGPFGETATAWFFGTLACTANATVLNQDYRVDGSDQGVASTAGAPVSFTIAAPTINTSIVHSPEPAVVSSTVLFTATASTDGTPLSYVWNLGDGSTASGLTASHVYTHDGSYTAIFTATDACNFTRVQTSTVTVNAPTINANFNQSATSVVVSTSVNFTDTSTTDLPPIAAWEWDFGDGTPHAFTQNANHTFMTLGVHTVRLTVTDTLGYSAFHTSTVTVNAPTINANFNQSATSTVVNSTVYFTDTSSTNGPPIVGWGWNFGDGSLSTTQHPAHLYTTVGSYTVTLLITDSLGYTATHSVVNAVSVQPACTSLTNVALTYTPAKPLIHTSVAFTATIVPIGVTPPLTYVWNFGDSSVLTNTVPTIQHAYQVIGTQTASVTAYNACTPLGVSAQQTITIEPYRLFLPLALKN